MNNLKELGKFGEEIAAEYLADIGYSIIKRNYRCENGEIDVIAKDNDVIVFIEVKTRRSLKYGIPQSAVTQQKQSQISMVALSYLNQVNAFDSPCRFDVIAITLPPASKELQIEHIQNAFEYQE